MSAALHPDHHVDGGPALQAPQHKELRERGAGEYVGGGGRRGRPGGLQQRRRGSEELLLLAAAVQPAEPEGPAAL